MHEVPERKLYPRGEQKRGRCGGNADRVQEVTNDLVWLDGKEQDQKNIDTAKMEWEIRMGKQPQGQEPSQFPDLVAHQERGHDPQHSAPSLAL